MPTLPQPISVAIIDDDQPSIDLLAEALSAHSEVTLCGTATDLESGLRMVASCRPDILFLDIEFPGAMAIDLVGPGRGDQMKIVFYSAYGKYLLEALRKGVFDFLLKPMVPGDLEMILSRFKLERSQILLPGPRSLELRMPTADSRPLSIVTITNERVIVSPSAIVYFRYDADRKIWEAVLNNLQRHMLKRHTTADTILNYGQNFVRTHKAFIVNTSYLALVGQTECRLLPPLEHITEIKISKGYRRDLLDRFYDI